MFKSIILSLALVLCVSAAKMERKHPKGQGHKDMNMTCKGEPLKMKALDEQFRAVQQECIKEMFPKTANSSLAVSENEQKEAHKKMIHEIMNNTCLHVCIWKKQKMLKEDGSFNVESFDKIIQSVLPQSVHATFKKAVEECVATHGKSFSMENKCEGYKQFKDCKMSKIMEICETKPREHKRPE